MAEQRGSVVAIEPPQQTSILRLPFAFVYAPVDPYPVRHFAISRFRVYYESANDLCLQTAEACDLFQVILTSPRETTHEPTSRLIPSRATHVHRLSLRQRTLVSSHILKAPPRCAISHLIILFKYKTNLITRDPSHMAWLTINPKRKIVLPLP